MQTSGASWRSVAAGQWGLVAEAGGWPLHVGLRSARGLLSAQSEVLAAGVAEPGAVLARNRRLATVHFSCTAAGAVWVQGDIPERAAVYDAEVDRLLGALVAAADELRSAHAARRRD